MDSFGNHEDQYEHGLTEDDEIWHQIMKVHPQGDGLEIDSSTLEEACVERVGSVPQIYCCRKELLVMTQDVCDYRCAGHAFTVLKITVSPFLFSYIYINVKLY